MLDVSRTELTPLAFLERAADVYAAKPAVRYRGKTITYAELAAGATRTANALRAGGIRPGDRVAYLCPNLPEMLLAHFAVPLAGAVLVAINTRLSDDEVRYILDHSGARMLFADTELLAKLSEETTSREVVAIDDAGLGVPVGAVSLTEFLRSGSDEELPWAVADEESTISINYTSGTTGRPKGVAYTHRGAHLNALAEVVHSDHSAASVYLWTLPMFHCNGWCTTWGVTAVGGTHVALRAVDFDEVWRLMRTEGITHLNAAPTVLTGMANHPEAAPFGREVVVTTAGAPPSPTIIGQMEKLGARLVHVYGLTETYGPYTVCEPQPELSEADAETRSRFLARQGVAYVSADPIRVVDGDMNDVPRDGETMGEVVMRGNNVMKEYFADPEATAHAFRGGWFHSGDIAVWHRDGYIELRDRSKDIVISGGENISTIEVEQALVAHDAVLEAAVVAIPDAKWGERPKAFVVLKAGRVAGEVELVEFVRSRIARYKAPDRVEFVDALPKTSTGKIQKYLLREAEWAGRETQIN